MPGWPLEGPPLTHEFLEGVKSTGHELHTHAEMYISSAGVVPNGGVATEYRVIMTALHFLITFDQINIENLAAGEYLLRRARMIQKAVQKNARSPDFTGLSMNLTHKLDPHGGINTVSYDRHVACEQRLHADNLKQTRLVREEEEHDDKRHNRGGGEGGRGRGRG